MCVRVFKIQNNCGKMAVYVNLIKIKLKKSQLSAKKKLVITEIKLGKILKISKYVLESKKLAIKNML